jgi:hypothetical protein
MIAVERLLLDAYSGHDARAAALLGDRQWTLRSVGRPPTSGAYFRIARIRQSGLALSLVVQSAMTR